MILGSKKPLPLVDPQKQTSSVLLRGEALRSNKAKHLSKVFSSSEWYPGTALGYSIQHPTNGMRAVEYDRNGQPRQACDDRRRQNFTVVSKGAVYEKSISTSAKHCCRFNAHRMSWIPNSQCFDTPCAHKSSVDGFGLVSYHSEWASSFARRPGGGQCAPKSSVEGAGLVSYHSDWPSSFATLPGGQVLFDLTAAWDGLAGRLAPSVTSGKHMQLVLSALKLAFGALHRVPEGGRLMLANSLALAYTLADLKMDARVMAAGLLHSAVGAGLVSISLVYQELGSDVGRLLHDCMRLKRTIEQMDVLDEENSRAVRNFCISYHDILAIVIEVSSHLQQMRLANDLPRYHQQILALKALQVHAPLAHAIGIKEVSMDLEDLAFRIILPVSYEFLNHWLHSHWLDEKSVIEECKLRLSSALEQDQKLKLLTEGFTVLGRLKSRFSIMKKLLKDGRKPEEVYDVIGLRVIVASTMDSDDMELMERGRNACYRVLEIVRSLWTEIPGRLKDYIAYPKFNGYESLHVAVYLNNSNLYQATMELQIRTSSMDFQASDGDASHSLYKGGLTNPEQAQQLKKLMMTAANHAALSLQNLDNNLLLARSCPATDDQMFIMFDKNKDGQISISEFQHVMENLGVEGQEVQELMQLVDINRDGTVSAEEFAEFRKKVSCLQGFDKRFMSRLRQTFKDCSSDS